jgi:phosphoglycolate phosphatase-like HAD superfamily hydrolase
MSRYFTAVRGAPAEKGPILKALIQHGGFDPRRVLMVGDALADCAGAREAGTAFVGRVTDATAALFPPGTPVIEDLKGLPDLL